MNLRTLRAVFFLELRQLLRDPRTLFFGAILPALAVPLVFYVSSLGEKGREQRQQERVFRYAVVGQEAERVRALLAEWVPEEGEGEEEETPLKLEEVEVEDAAAALAEKTIDAYLEAFGAPPDTLLEERPAVPRFRLAFRGNRDASSTTMRALRERLEQVRESRREALLMEYGFPVPVAEVLPEESLDLASGARRTGASLGRWAGFFLIFMVLVGGSTVAADTLAGEKERGTLETLLTTAAGRREILLAKQAAIAALGVAIAGVQLLALGLSLWLSVFELPPEFAVDLSPATLLLIFLLALPLVAVVASLLLLVSGRSKSYREFQVLFFPVFLLFLLPAGAAFLPAVELRSAILLVPVANLCVGLREIFEGTFDLPALAAAWLISAAAAWAVGRLTLRALAAERLVVSAHLDAARFRGGEELFSRHVLAWFGGMWALLFVAAANIPALGMDGQLLLNLVVIFLGGSLLMLRIYRLDSRKVLLLESPNPAVWPAVILGAPAFFLVALLVARLAGWLFPIPEAALEQYAQLTDSTTRPLWELLLLVAVLPGICEEIAFRGVLLHGLRQRLRPLWACLLVGVIFAAFHIDLVRLLGTAVLGVLLAGLTLHTRSIYPAMLWHILNNGTAIVAAYFELPLESIDVAVYGPAVLVSALCLLWIWRQGAPTVAAASPSDDPG